MGAHYGPFDETVQLTNTWIKELMDRLGWDDPHRAYRGLRATLQALRDRLPPDEAAHLAAQLPMLVRGFYYEGWRPSATPNRDRSLDDFVSHIEHAFAREPGVDCEAVAREVFALLDRHVSAGEIKDVRRLLPEHIRALWMD